MKRFIAVIGGDGRYLELIRQLQLIPDATVFLVGFDKLEQGYTGLKQVDIADLQVEKLDAVILPITGVDDEGYVETVFSNQQIQLTKSWFTGLKPRTMVFTGIANSYLINAAESAGMELVKLLSRDDVAIYNSIPTAEGAIKMAIEQTDYTIHSSRIIVAGFGRVGKTVSNKFSAFGANVSVSANDSSDLARITEMGLKAISLEKLHAYTHMCDLLINTIPAPVINKEAIQHLPSHGLIIDLASKPGGVDFKYAEQRGIKSILAPSLPGVVAPKTSGKILADVIKQCLQEHV